MATAMFPLLASVLVGCRPSSIAGQNSLASRCSMAPLLKLLVACTLDAWNGSNVISGELPDESSSRRKKAIHVGQIGGWCAREQSCITKAFGMSASDPALIAQLGEDYVEFSMKLQPAGMYISSPLLTYSDDALL